MIDVKGHAVWARDGAVMGTATGGTQPCRMEGCMGRRLTVKWPDGKYTYPRTKGMSFDNNSVWRIE